MTLLERTRQTATRRNRARQETAETCMDQIVKVAGIPEQFVKHDRAGNLEVETMFATLYQLVDSDDERAAVAKAFVLWQADERHETRVVRDLSDDAVDLLKTNVPAFVDGAWVPGDSDGAA